MAMNQEDYNNYIAVVSRMEAAKNLLTAEEMHELRSVNNCFKKLRLFRRLLVPEETRVIRMESEKPLWYSITPDHQGSLHTYYAAENPLATEG